MKKAYTQGALPTPTLGNRSCVALSNCSLHCSTSCVPTVVPPAPSRDGVVPREGRTPGAAIHAVVTLPHQGGGNEIPLQNYVLRQHGARLAERNRPSSSCGSCNDYCTACDRHSPREPIAQTVLSNHMARSSLAPLKSAPPTLAPLKST